MSAPPSLLPVTIITHEFHPMKGGIATFVEEMARGCKDLGHAVEVWAPRAALCPDKGLPYPVVRIPLRGTQGLCCQFRMARQMAAHRRDLRRRIVYLPEPGPVLAMTYLQFFRAFRPARLALTFHGSEIQSFASRPLARRLVGRLIAAADRITTPSCFTQRLVHERFPASLGKTVVTPGAVRAGFLGRDCSRVKTTDKVVVLTVGRLHPRKGQLHVLEALQRLPKPLSDRVEYWVVGRSVRGDYEARLRQAAKRSRVPVTMLGSIEDGDLELIYRRADIFALTSVNHGHSVEGFGLAYLEASGFGLPIVGHAVGGVPEAVRHGETGLLVSADDADGLRDAFARLVADQGARERMGAAGRLWAHRHSWRTSAHTLLDGLASAAPPRPDVEQALQPA
jgi:glycosyltransferase involved in cell wall biosynthesis